MLDDDLERAALISRSKAAGYYERAVRDAHDDHRATGAGAWGRPADLRGRHASDAAPLPGGPSPYLDRFAAEVIPLLRDRLSS
ncbi:hypothetical protein MOV08_01165 [Streptomyces yunnanensis]|uniref:Uncharacterized protein n=1 Tax=Streptomyces yunnanensis TaxID=156453 RepID=A0ABY8A1G0_9ACTN|nr:hypothetical protein [Streptomyces yunnanensis]WEB38054.1 hypothetical protein MOV08_01165 [Streptomyces yunnanensis]